MPATDERLDPYLGFRFRVRVDQETVGGFSEVAGIQAEVEVLNVAEGGLNDFVHKLPGRAKQGNLQLRRGLVSAEMWEWFAKIVAGDIERKTVAVELLDEAGRGPVLRWVFESAFPCRWNGPELKATQSGVAVESVDLCHHGFLVES